jgi:beta-phosphoglucomutase-like phosphatase (HAD superfamily)
MQSSPILPRSVENASPLKRWWGRLFGPKFLPDTAGPQSGDRKRSEAEAMLRLGDEAPIADPTVETVDKLPDHRAGVAKQQAVATKKARRARTSAT